MPCKTMGGEPLYLFIKKYKSNSLHLFQMKFCKCDNADHLADCCYV